jgi:DNA-binding transcriptional LysR family regulator
MPIAIARFRERHPAVELSMQLAEPPDGIAQLRAGDCDVALIIQADHDTTCDDGIARTHLLDDPMYVALPAAHPLARQPSVRLDALAGEAWMLGASNRCPDASIFLRSCQRAGFEPTVAFHTDDYFAIQGFVAAGMGVSFIPDLALVSVRDDIVIRSLGPGAPVRRILAATLADSFSSPARQAMLEILAEVGAEFAGGRRTLALAS